MVTCGLKVLVLPRTMETLISFRLYKFRTHVKILRIINIRIEIKYLSLKAVEGKKE